MKPYYRFLVTILAFLACFLVLDRCIGKAFDRILRSMPYDGTETLKTEFALRKVEAPVLIVGSSRADHHYVTRTIGDSLGISTYNIGRDGSFLSYNCCVNHVILGRYTPRLIVWENDVNGFYKESSDFLERLYPYCDLYPYVREAVVESNGKKEGFKLLLKTYQYNYAAIRLLFHSVFRNKAGDPLLGYSPLAPKRPAVPLRLKNKENMPRHIDSIKVERFRNTVSLIKKRGVRLVVVDSPRYQKEQSRGSNLSCRIMAQICRENGVPFIDNRSLPLFLEHPEFFQDAGHLNADGAEVYTSIFLHQLRDLGITRGLLNEASATSPERDATEASM